MTGRSVMVARVLREDLVPVQIWTARKFILKSEILLHNEFGPVGKWYTSTFALYNSEFDSRQVHPVRSSFRKNLTEIFAYNGKLLKVTNSGIG